jgi:hypothetical protein
VAPLLLVVNLLNSLVNLLATPTVNNGAVTIKIIRRTSITSTKGVTLISLIGSFDERFNLNAI